MKICKVSGCGKPSKARGLCGTHWARWRKMGEASLDAPIKETQGQAMRFLLTVLSSNTDDCVIWPFGKERFGYGKVYYEGRDQLAHRVALLLSEGPPPVKGMHVAHDPAVCSSPACINPVHLRYATAKENCEDKRVSGTLAEGSKVGTARINLSKAKAILVAPGSYREIAGEFGVSRSTVGDIKTGKTWKSARC